MSFTNITAVFQKQCKDIFKNKEILAQFILFPVIAIIMENAVQIEGMPENYFVNLFATMFIGMAPLTAMAAILAEEKEKNTLRMLFMSNVKPSEYLIGTGSYIWCISMFGGCVFGITANYQGKVLVHFLLIMAAGILASMLIGAAIGAISKTQMMATSLTVPVMMIFAFLPMLSMFNKTIEKVSAITYSGQISRLLNQVQTVRADSENVLVILFNMALAAAVFGYAYKKSGLV